MVLGTFEGGLALDDPQKGHEEGVVKGKAQQQKDLEEQKKMLAAALKEIEDWKEKSQQNIRNQVKDVFDTVIQENTQLREQIKILNNALENEHSQVKKLEEMLKERPK